MAYTRHKKTYPAKANTNTWQPGVSGNPNGRPKGSKNKFSKQLKDHIKKILGKHILNLDDDLASMTAKDRVAAQTAFLKYFLTSSKEIKHQTDTKVNVQVNYVKKEQPKIINDDVTLFIEPEIIENKTEDYE